MFEFNESDIFLYCLKTPLGNVLGLSTCSLFEFNKRCVQRLRRSVNTIMVFSDVRHLDMQWTLNTHAVIIFFINYWVYMPGA